MDTDMSARVANAEGLLRNYRDLPHDKQMHRAEMVERYAKGGMPITQSVDSVAKEDNVQPRTIYRARKYAAAFLEVPEDIRETLATFVNEKKVKVEYIYQVFATLDESKQRDAVARWANGEFPVATNNGRDGQPVLSDVAQEETEAGELGPSDLRVHSHMQVLLAECGEAMGFQIWIPSRDRRAVLSQWKPKQLGTLLDSLPLNFDEEALRTIREIDVLWVKKKAIRRAFEIEHSTLIYSGLLRMSDLLAQLPTTVFNLHIVAPPERRDRVLREIDRPTFRVLDTPLHKCCTFLSYESVERIRGMEHLEYLPDSVLEEYVEWVENDE